MEIDIFSLRKIDGTETLMRLAQDGFSKNLRTRFNSWRKRFPATLDLFHRKLYSEAVSGVEKIHGKEVWENLRTTPTNDDKAHNFDNSVVALAVAVFCYKWPEFDHLFDRKRNGKAPCNLHTKRAA